VTFLCLGSPFPRIRHDTPQQEGTLPGLIYPCAVAWVGGELQTTRPSRLGDPHETRPRKRRAPGVVCPSDAELAEYAKQVVDGLPPLTDEQRDVLALIFGSNRRKRGE
jgi:hypothetical protein